MRLVDADALIDSLNIRSVTYNCIINKCIEDAPTVEIVRCGECKHRETDDCPIYWMEWITIDEGDGYTDNDFIIHDYTTDDGYCNYGERKGGDTE